MGGFKHTGVADGTSRTHYGSIGQLQDGGIFALGAVGGTADALTANLSPAITAYATGQHFRGIAASTNATTTPTIAISGLTAKTFVRPGGTALAAADIVAGKLIEFTYDGTSMVLTNAAGAYAAATTYAFRANNLSDLANAGTARTNLGSTTVGDALFITASAAAARTTLGLGTLATQSGTFSGTSSGTNTGDQTITLTGGVTGTGTGSFAATVVTNANLTGDITSAGNATTIQSVNGFTVGYRQVPRSTTSTTAATSDVNKCIAITANIAIPNSTFAAGDAFSIYNDSAGALTITATVATLRQAGTTNTGNRTLAARGLATVWFNSATEAIISGAGVT
jgi:hypothetical protein